jgi:hypothetical protein
VFPQETTTIATAAVEATMVGATEAASVIITPPQVALTGGKIKQLGFASIKVELYFHPQKLLQQLLNQTKIP